ncbi:MAG: permease [Acidobacteria bacterium]|nr:MAG: permease [Acidobacteriota bacterium]
MRALYRLFTRLFNFTTRRRDDERFREEIESHIAAQTDENIRAGMTPDEARRHARLKFGAVEAVREDYRAEKGLPFVENLLLDVRYALRILQKSPAFTVVALVTLARGIGANVIGFGVLNAILLRPLGMSDPQSLYQIRHQQWMTGRLLTTTYPAFEDFQQRNTTFSGMAAYYGYSQGLLRWQNTEVPVLGDEVTTNYFDVLGVKPQFGRFFHAADEPGADSVPYIVLSDGLWRNAFHGNPDVVGMSVEFRNRSFTVVGVAPPEFHGTDRLGWAEFWIPMATAQRRQGRTSLVTVIGRLKPGVTSQQATENLSAISAELGKEYPATDDGQPLRLIHPGLLGDAGDVIRGFLYSVSLLALLVLTAACANLATLFASRAADRSRELALRVALGSSGQRIMRQLLTEAALVSLLGGAAGLVTANLLLGMLNQWRPLADVHLSASMDARVYLAGLLLTLGSAVLFGIFPARQACRNSPLQMIKDGPADALSLRRFAVRDLLLAGQIAICMLLVTASLVGIRGMVRILNTPLGFQPEGAMLAGINVTGLTPEAALQKKKAMIEAVRNLPGITNAGSISNTPFTGGLRGTPVYRPGTTELKLNNAVVSPYVLSVSPGYLEAAKTRLLSGRDVSWHDTPGSPAVAIVNETFAQKMWGATSAIGQTFILSGKPTEVVGVAQDGKYHDFEEQPQAALFVPLSQNVDSDTILVVRSQLEPNEMTASLRSTLGGRITAHRWSESVDEELRPARAAATGLVVLGLLAAMLVVTGVFGMAAYSVSRRMKELGIRVALGANRSQVMRAAIGRTMVLLGAGSSVGLLAGIFAHRLLEKFVYRANPQDPVVAVGAALTMALLGIVASAIPARRALAIDPSKLMREE